MKARSNGIGNIWKADIRTLSAISAHTHKRPDGKSAFAALSRPFVLSESFSDFDPGCVKTLLLCYDSSRDSAGEADEALR